MQLNTAMSTKPGTSQFTEERREIHAFFKGMERPPGQLHCNYIVLSGNLKGFARKNTDTTGSEESASGEKQYKFISYMEN